MSALKGEIRILRNPEYISKVVESERKNPSNVDLGNTGKKKKNYGNFLRFIFNVRNKIRYCGNILSKYSKISPALC